MMRRIAFYHDVNNQKLLMTGFRNVQKPNFLTLNPSIFKILTVSHFLTLLTPTSCKILEKTGEPPPRYLKTDGLTRAINMDPIR